jgi:hypothetical protein
MNDFSDIEKDLRSLRPASPSSRLIEGIARQLEEPAAQTDLAEDKVIRPPWFRFGGLSLGATLAAAAAIFILARVDTFTIERHGSKTARATPVPAALNSAQFIPDGATRVVYHTQDDGLIFPQGTDRPIRRISSRTKETLQWRNPGTGASLSVTYPSEEVRFIPVSGQ